MSKIRTYLNIFFLCVVVSFIAFTVDAAAAPGDENNSYPSLETKRYNVTEVYSINNTIDEAFYKPKLEEAGLLEEKVLQQGFVSAYTGYFDLDHTEPNKSGGSTSRALEILGYDFLLDNESYSDGEYSYAKTPDNMVSKKTAVMDIYKALGKEELNYVFEFQSVDKSILEQSPAIIGLPFSPGEVVSTWGRTNVFITRTNPDKYVQKAVTDLKMSEADLSAQSLTAGEFIVLVMNMMKFYGEPVISEQEVNAMLQVWGNEIPSYLSSIETEAYLYLRVRGIINDTTIDYSKPLKLSQMLEILMCVKDIDSRTTFKEIQVTMDIGDNLVNHGYFPKSVTVVDGSDAIEVSTKVSFADTTFYDYLIEVNDTTRFVDSSGNPVSSLVVPSIPDRPESTSISGVSYLGTESGPDGKLYYHMQIPILSDDSEYITATNGWIQVNTLSDSDKPYYIWLEQGGGIYSNAQSDGNGGVTMSRSNFTHDEYYDTYYSKERVDGSDNPYEDNVSIAKSVNDKTTVALLSSALSSVYRLIQPMTVYAAPYENILTVEVTLYNVSNIKMESIEDFPDVQIKDGVYEDTSVVTIPKGQYSRFLASIERDESKTQQKVFDGIATLNGDLLIKYKDLKERDLVYTADGEEPTQDAEGRLYLNTKYGRVILNKKTNTIVTGNNVFKLSGDDIVLFEYVYNESTGDYDLYVDFRAAYGWTANIMDIVVTGTEGGYTLNVTTKETTNEVVNVKEINVRKPLTFTGISDFQTAGVLRDGVVDDSGLPRLVLSYNYCLANYIIYYGKDRSGREEDYCIVYYPKSIGISDEDVAYGEETVRRLFGYITLSDNWVCRAFKLDRSVTTDPGKFTYTENFGYIYNLPSNDDFTLDKYISGEYILPLSASSYNTVLYDYNVNRFAGLEYGQRPYYDVISNTTRWIDIKGVKGDVSESSSLEMYAAPVGISMFFGGAGAVGNISDAAKVGYISEESPIYYGSVLTPVKYTSSSGNVRAMVSFTSNESWSKTLLLPKDSDVYQINIVPKYNSNNGEYSIKAVYAYFGSGMNTDYAEEEEYSGNIDNTTIITEKRDDENFGVDGFSLDRLIKKIDEGTTFGILFCFVILPLVGIILLTMLVGFGLIANSVFFRNIFAKTIDPIKILTVGVKTCETFRFKESIGSIILGYISLSMILDGNVFRFIKYLAAWINVFIELVRQL